MFGVVQHAGKAAERVQIVDAVEASVAVVRCEWELVTIDIPDST